MLVDMWINVPVTEFVDSVRGRRPTIRRSCCGQCSYPRVSGLGFGVGGLRLKPQGAEDRTLLGSSGVEL